MTGEFVVHGAVRVGLAVVTAVALVVPVFTGTALADPVVPTTSKPVTLGAGPDDLISYAAQHLPADTATTVSLDGVGVNYHADLPTQTTTADGTLVSPAGQRTPADMTPGSYTVTFAQPAPDGGDAVTLTTPAFVIRTPALLLLPPATFTPHPGETMDLYLQGVGSGPQVHRTVAVDGQAVAGTPADDSRGVRETITLPTTTTPGSHTVTLTQDVNPTVTLTASLTVATPTLELSVASTSTRGWFDVTGRDFGFGDSVAITVRDGGRDQYALTTTPGGVFFRARVYLPGIGSGAATVTATSAHNHASASAGVGVAPSLVRSPASLAAGAQLQSPRGYGRFAMQSDGNLVLYVLGRARWSSGTAGHPGARLAIQTDGNLVVYSSAGGVLWTSRTANQGTRVELVVQDDGNTVLYNRSGTALWNTHTAGAPATLLPGQTLAPGEVLTGPGQVRLVMQTDGEAVLYGRSGSPVWTSRTYGTDAGLTLQTDGNLVVYGQNGIALWSNRALVGAGTRLVAQSDGNLVEYGANGKAVWSTGTAGR